ncbi:hypothetical protein QAD02_003722 [Eretmocerus hayati]|uniref:Uncharacterized protein n=1 Tax=Eretmocerus hayati TaxID=131215 RepID=A0ACC2NNL7_9HYME|nr:hypothetical protein QAD02_003722 [Eretmocerus hayati]
MARSFTKQRFHYNLRRREWEPKVGELVLKKLHTLSNKAKHYNAALDKKADGPYRIRKKTSPVIFDLEDDEGNVITDIHVKDLSPYRSNDSDESDEDKTPRKSVARHT